MQHKLYEQSYPEGERWMMSTSFEATANMWYDLDQNNSSRLYIIIEYEVVLYNIHLPRFGANATS